MVCPCKLTRAPSYSNLATKTNQIPNLLTLSTTCFIDFTQPKIEPLSRLAACSSAPRQLAAHYKGHHKMDAYELSFPQMSFQWTKTSGRVELNASIGSESSKYSLCLTTVRQQSLTKPATRWAHGRRGSSPCCRHQSKRKVDDKTHICLMKALTTAQDTQARTCETLVLLILTSFTVWHVNSINKNDVSTRGDGRSSNGYRP